MACRTLTQRNPKKELMRTKAWRENGAIHHIPFQMHSHVVLSIASVSLDSTRWGTAHEDPVVGCCIGLVHAAICYKQEPIAERVQVDVSEKE